MSQYNIAQGGLARAATGIADAQAARRMEADRQAIAQKLMDMQSPSTIIPPSVETLLAHQAEALVQLHSAIDALSNALSPALRPPAVPDIEAQQANRVANSPLAQHILNDTLGIEAATAMLHEIRNRLDL